MTVCEGLMTPGMELKNERSYTMSDFCGIKKYALA